MPEQIVYCEDCKHYIESALVHSRAKCKLFPLSERFNLVTRKRDRPVYPFCGNMRRAGDECGPTASKFERKEP